MLRLCAIVFSLFLAIAATGAPEEYTIAREAGVAKYKQRDWQGAIADFSTALRHAETDTQRGELYLYLGNCFRAGDDPRRAEATYEQVLELPEASPALVYQAHLGIARAAARRHDEERVRQAYQAIVDQEAATPSQRCQAYLSLGDSFAREQRLDDAQRAIAAGIAVEGVPLPLRLAGMLQLGNQVFAQNQPAKARDIFATVLTTPDAPAALRARAQHRIGLTWFAEENYPKARESLSRAAEMEGIGNNLPETTLYLGLCHLQERQYELARRELEKIPYLKGATAWHLRTARQQLEQLDRLAGK